MYCTYMHYKQENPSNVSSNPHRSPTEHTPHRPTPPPIPPHPHPHSYMADMQHC